MRDLSDEELETLRGAAWEAEDWRRAAEVLEEQLRRRPGDRVAAFDAALAHKFLRNWQRAYELGKVAAAEGERGAQDPAFWNLGIAATIQRDWATARDAWAAYGVTVPAGEGEIAGDFGVCCVRLDADGGEVVWARRLCPTRARVLSVPFTGSYRFGDVILHDGAPNGERRVGDHAFPVFDELLLWSESDIPTHQTNVTAPTADSVESLLDLFSDAGYAAEPHSEMIVMCKCCSEGSVDSAPRPPEPGAQTVWLAAPHETATALLDTWLAASPADRSWDTLHRITP